MKFESYKVTPGANIDLDKWSTLPTREESEVDFEEEIQKNIEKMDDLQKALYGESKQSLLVIFQGIDAAGKDSTIRAVFSGINPAGISVTSFKKPSQEELSHDYLWRHVKALPRRGEIAIFNRSHYENVLITKVHPELILFENLPGIESVSDIGEDFYENRYQQINQFEEHLSKNGTKVIKFFLHVSKEEQKNRFIERIENPEKNYKFSALDLKERALWDRYKSAFETMLEKTSTNNSPWYIVPIDDKKFAQSMIAYLVRKTLEQLNPQFRELSAEEKAEMQELYHALKNEA